MHKILLIEDRVERQKLFSDQTGFDLENYKSILDNRTGLDGIALDQYGTIICHRSAFAGSNSSVLDILKEHCKKTGAKLVFFSGGISSTFYSHNEYEFCLLNSKAFYSENLILYLDEVTANHVSNIRLLAYGLNWKINIMLNTLSRVNLFIAFNADKNIVKAQRFKTFSHIDNLIDIIDIEQPESGAGGGIELQEVRAFAGSLYEIVNQEIMINA